MKVIFKIAAVFACVALYCSCNDMNSIHEKYFDLSERTYIGLPDIVEIRPGLERAEVVWTLNADPRVEESNICWNDGADTLLVVELDSIRPDTLRQMLTLAEANYIIEMYNTGVEETQSLSVEVPVSVYGAEYIKKLGSRPIINVGFDAAGGKITWGNVEGCLKTIVTYKDSAGSEVKLVVPQDESSTVIADAAADSEFTFSSAYLPENNALDTVYSSAAVESFPVYEVQ